MPEKQKNTEVFKPEHAALIEAGRIGVIPTDTLYGLVGSALSDEVVELIYGVKERDPKKPLIVLVSKIDDLRTFGVRMESPLKAFLKENWPGKLSVVVPVGKPWKFLHRGTGRLAFRLPDRKDLREFLKTTGPLVAPSANPEGKPPAETIAQAKKYFRDGDVSFFIDGGSLKGKPSTLVEYENHKFKILRQGAVKIDF